MTDLTFKYKNFLKLDFFFMFFVFILLPLLYEYEISSYLIMLLPLMLYFKLSSSNIHINIKDRKLISVIVNFILVIIWMFLLLLIHGIEKNSLIRIIQFICCFCCFWYGVSLENPNKYIKDISYLINLNLLFIFIVFLFKIDSYGSFSYIFQNSNSLGSLLFGWLGLFMYNNNKYIIPIFLALSVITGTRSLMLCCIIMFLLSRRVNLSCAKEKLEWFFRFELLFLILFTLYYPISMNSDLGTFLQLKSQALLGKNFYSGRDYIWNEVIQAINQAFMVGYGLGVVPKDLFGFGWSAHNLFLQTILQQGIIGGILLINLIASIFSKASHMNSRFSYSCSVFIIALLIHESFEISLTQNMLASGLMIWTVLGLGINNKLN